MNILYHCALNDIIDIMRSKIEIDKKRLFDLYHQKRMSPYKIAGIFDCSFSTVTNRLKEHRIRLKTKSQAQMIYQKQDFNGSNIEKAYMIGFRLGDLNVYKTSATAETIIVRCNTSSEAQIKLIKGLFGKYGHVTVCNSKNDKRNINCHLNNSFAFLLKKEDKVDNWIQKSNNANIAFAAGYTDAEGSFLIDQGKGRFKIDSYDKNIIHWFHRWLVVKNIRGKILLVGKKGESRPDGSKFNFELWRININEARSLYKFIKMIKQYLRHKKRALDAEKVFKNINIRKQNGTIK